MKVIILAAGKSNELNSFSVDCPKCMLKIGHETLIEHQINTLNAAGIKNVDITVVIGYKYKDVILPKGINTIINNDYLLSNNSKSLFLALKNNSNDDYLIIDDDLIFDDKFIKKINNKTDNLLICVTGKSRYGSTGVMCNSNGRVTDIGKHINSEITYIGIMKIRKDTIKALNEQLFNYTKTWYTIPLSKILSKKEFGVQISDDNIFEINTYTDYLRIKRELGLENNLILVLGASGFLGKKLFHVLKRNHSVIGTQHQNTFSDLLTLDLCNKEELSAFIALKNPSIIINTVGMADPDACEKNKTQAERINVYTVQNLVEICKKYSIKLIHISTDYVFDGNKKQDYSKIEERKPINFYGKTKVWAEDLVSDYKNSLIVRIPIIYGYNDENDKKTFPTKIIELLSKGKEIKLDNQQIRYPVLIDEVALSIEKSLNKTGIIHITSPNGVTKYEWANVIAKEYGFSEKLLSIENGKLNKRPKHIKLETSAEDFIVSDIYSGTKILKKQMSCVFKMIYKSHPYSTIYGKNVGKYRFVLGQKLGENIPQEIINELDCVVPVPSSGLFYAMGVAAQIKKTYLQALVKPDTSARSFQISDISLREKVIHDKIYAIPELLQGKTVALVDEAIFTGVTLKVVCDMVRACGVKKIYIFIPTPICQNRCQWYVHPDRKLLAEKTQKKELVNFFLVENIVFQDKEVFSETLKDFHDICFDCFR